MKIRHLLIAMLAMVSFGLAACGGGDKKDDAMPAETPTEEAPAETAPAETAPAEEAAPEEAPAPEGDGADDEADADGEAAPE